METNNWNSEISKFLDLSYPIYLSAEAEEKRRAVVEQLEDTIGTDEIKRLIEQKGEPIEVTLSLKGAEENGSYEV